MPAKKKPVAKKKPPQSKGKTLAEVFAAEDRTRRKLPLPKHKKRPTRPGWELLAPVEVAKWIGLPLSEWPGNCHGVANLIVEKKLIDGISRYGVYLGPIAKTGYFAGRPVSRHGWIESKDGHYIIDPTRWVFLDIPPSIYVTTTDDPEYDLAGNRLGGADEQPPPGKDADDRFTDLVFLKDEQAAREFVEDTFVTLRLNLSQLHWLGNQSPQKLGDAAAGVYKALHRAGKRVTIPIDNWQFVFGEYPT